jgi:hypothetical protein
MRTSSPVTVVAVDSIVEEFGIGEHDVNHFFVSGETMISQE